MAKKQPKNLHELKREAKTFHDLHALIVADHQRVIRIYEGFLKPRRRRSKANRAEDEAHIRHHEAQIRSANVRLKRYEDYQADKRIPAALRKRISELETEILRLEPAYQSYERGALRSMKKALTELFEQAERIRNPPQPLSTTNRAFKVHKDYPAQSITRSYDGHVWEVLKSHFEQLPRAKGQRASVRIVATLPEKAEYLLLKERHYTRTLETLVDDAYEIVDDLRDELQDAYDNMPEGLQGSAVGEARCEAAEELDAISSDQPELPGSLFGICLVHYPPLHEVSRRDRAGGAADMLRAAVEAVKRFRESNTKLKKTEAKAVDEVAAQLEDHAEQIEYVDFPGMFG